MFDRGERAPRCIMTTNPANVLKSNNETPRLTIKVAYVPI